MSDFTNFPTHVVVGHWGNYVESRTADGERHAKKIKAGWKGRHATRLQVFRLTVVDEVPELAWEREE
ncbi:hypothetical protein [Streptomyces sp. NPDC001422]|uniref:hypothetical protein n=1 Tax=Streptomyces sp. NPDC001422 TaxID=3364575 RepID=UPI0036A798D5